MSEDPKLFVRRAGLGASPGDWTFAAHPDEAEFNLFRYCGNDPIDFADPMGLENPAWLDAVVPGAYEYDQGVTHLRAGNYGTAAGWFGTMLASIYVGVETGTGSTRANASFRAARAAAAERQIAGVIGKYKNSPNYLHVAENLRAKAFDVPPHIFAKMSEAQQWAANQKFLDIAIARGGDFLLDKPIKDISSTSGGLRKELDYLSDQGFVFWMRNPFDLHYFEGEREIAIPEGKLTGDTELLVSISVIKSWMPPFDLETIAQTKKEQITANISAALDFLGVTHEFN